MGAHDAEEEAHDDRDDDFEGELRDRAVLLLQRAEVAQVDLREERGAAALLVHTPKRVRGIPPLYA